MTESSDDDKDARIADLESLVRFERATAASEREHTDAAQAELAERVAALTGHSQQLAAENQRLTKKVAELSRPGAGLRRIARGVRSRLKKARGAGAKRS